MESNASGLEKTTPGITRRMAIIGGAAALLGIAMATQVSVPAFAETTDVEHCWS